MSDEIIKKQMKKDLEEVYRNTYKKMLEKHPDQKEIIDKMLEAKLKSLDKGDES